MDQEQIHRKPLWFLNFIITKPKTKGLFFPSLFRIVILCYCLFQLEWSGIVYISFFSSWLFTSDDDSIWMNNVFLALLMRVLMKRNYTWKHNKSQNYPRQRRSDWFMAINLELSNKDRDQRCIHYFVGFKCIQKDRREYWVSAKYWIPYGRSSSYYENHIQCTLSKQFSKDRESLNHSSVSTITRLAQECWTNVNYKIYLRRTGIALEAPRWFQFKTTASLSSRLLSWRIKHHIYGD